MEISEDAKQVNSQTSARFEEAPEQLELALPSVPMDFLVRPLLFEEDTIVHRLHKGVTYSADEWIKLISESFERSAHKSKPKKHLQDEIEDAILHFLKQDHRSIAHPVAVTVTQDQPLHHKKLIFCPTYCLVFKFGPSARGPPIKFSITCHSVRTRYPKRKVQVLAT